MEKRHFGPVWFIPGEKKGKYPYCHSVYVEARLTALGMTAGGS